MGLMCDYISRLGCLPKPGSKFEFEEVRVDLKYQLIFDLFQLNVSVVHMKRIVLKTEAD